MARLFDAVSAKLLHAPAPGYSTFVEQTLAFALPILRESRRGIGLADHVSGNEVGDLLRVSPEVRAWTPEDGALQLAKRDLNRAPPELVALLDTLSAEQSWVKRRRPKGASRFVYEIDPVQLARVLGWSD